MRILRHVLSRKDKKIILEKIGKCMNISDIFRNKELLIELARMNNIRIYMINGKPYFYSTPNTEIIPTLILFLERGTSFLTNVVVDMGAVPHILNGADVMIPGIVEINGGLGKNQLCIIVDEKYHKPIAVGKAILDKEKIFSQKRGRAIKNIHYYNDKIWRIIKEIMRKL